MIRTPFQLALALALLVSATTGAALARPTVAGPWARPGADVFDTLAENAWYLPTADGAASLYVTEIGRGPPVVVLHGGAGQDFNYLIDAVRPVADRRRFILFDQRGSVLSPVASAAAKTITLDTLADDLETLRIALKTPQLTLFGHSFGSLLALRYYEKYPTHVAGLVLTGAFPAATPEGGFKATLSAARMRTKALMARPQVTEVLKREGLDGDKAAMTPKQRSARNRIVAFADFDLVHVERWRQLQGGGVFYNAAVDDAVGDSLPADFDIRPTLSAHPIPVTVIQGDRDYLDPGAVGWRGVKDARVISIPQASHVAWIDNPSAFAAAMRAAFARR